MAAPNDLSPAIWGLAGVIGTKAFDFLMAWRSDKRKDKQDTNLAELQAKTDERRDYLADGSQLRDRLDALQEKYSASLEREAVLTGKVTTLTDQVVFLKDALANERKERLADRQTYEADRRQWAVDRDALRRDLEEVRNRLPIGGTGGD